MGGLELAKIWGSFSKGATWVGEKMGYRGLKGVGHAELHSQLKWTALGLIPIMLAPGSSKEKFHGAASVLGVFALTMGMGSPARMQMWGAILGASPGLNKIGHLAVQSYRGVLESRTSAAVPFSHTTLNQDLAFQSMQYSMGRLNQANGMAGQASWMAARYLRN
jgi:hypothetical protein